MRLEDGSRLISDHKMTSDDFAQIASLLGRAPVQARKRGMVAARQATVPERVETRWESKETANTAQIGDWIVTALADLERPLRDATGHLNTYVIVASRFADLYDATDTSIEFGAVFRPKGIVSVLFLAGGFDILAPWGERQQASRGYILLNGPDVYGNHADTFEATYDVLEI